MHWQSCIGIVSVSDYTVQNIDRETVKKAYKSKKDKGGGASYIGVGLDRFY